MPHRTRRLVLAGRAAAGSALAGLAAYMWITGLSRAAAIAGPVTAVIALAGLFAPYLLPTYQPPDDTPSSAGSAAPTQGRGGMVIIADHGSVAAQHIGDVTMNAPPPNVLRSDGGAES